MSDAGGMDWPPDNFHIAAAFDGGSPLERWLLDNLARYHDLSPRDTTRKLVQHIEDFPEAFLDLLVRSNILDPIDDQADPDGDLHTSYWIPEPIPHEHDYRWNVTEAGMLVCVNDGCDPQLRDVEVPYVGHMALTDFPKFGGDLDGKEI